MRCNFQERVFLSAWNERRRTDGRLAETIEETKNALRPDQLTRLAHAKLSVIEEFDAMLARVGLDAKTRPLQGAARIDLYFNCVECSTRPACRSWLERGADHFGYREFCPNAPMFERLLRIEAWRGNDGA
jgi:hypothetical protein